MSAKIISLLNLKGGCCKTSTAVNLGGVLHEAKRKTILIDLDPQKSATMWAQLGGDNFPYPVIPLEVGNPKQFKAKLDQLAKEHKAEIILLDSPPALAAESLIAALISDLVLVPVTPSPLDIFATREAISTIVEARKERKGKLPKAALVPSRLVAGTVLAREIKDSLKQFNEPIAPAISMRVAIAESCIAGLPISHFAPDSFSHIEFKNLLKFVNNNLGK